MSSSSVIAEFPSSTFATSLDAVKATFEHLRGGRYVGRTVLLSGQSYEADGEQYLMYDATYRDGTFEFDRPVSNFELAAHAAGISSDRVTVDGGGHSVTILAASPSELAGFLDYIYREIYKILPLPDGQNYNFSSELAADK
jgi:hypothetical protein